MIENRDASAAFVGDSEADGLLTLIALALLAAALPWLLGVEVKLALPLSLLSLAFPVAAFYAPAEAAEARALQKPRNSSQVHMASQAISITVPFSTGTGLSG